MRLCLFGSSSTTLDKIYYDEAYRLGELMAIRGHSLIFGGGEQGLMGACVRGLESMGGKATGVSPRFFDIPGILHKECSEFIFTDTMGERKQIMEDMADAFLIVPGGVGTMEEFLEVFTLKQLGQMSKPIGILNTDHVYDILKELMDSMITKGFMKEECGSLCGYFDTPEELLDYIENAHDEPMDIHSKLE